jgi:hypothetical protein
MDTCKTCHQVVSNHPYRSGLLTGEAGVGTGEKLSALLKAFLRKSNHMPKIGKHALIMLSGMLFLAAATMVALLALWVVFPKTSDLGLYVGRHWYGLQLTKQSLGTADEMGSWLVGWFIGIGTLLVPFLTLLFSKRIGKWLLVKKLRWLSV